MSQMIPINFLGIEEGRFEKKCNRELQKLHDALLDHCQEYGQDNGPKATLTIKIELQASKDVSNAFAINTDFSRKEPGCPKESTMAILSETQEGQLALFMPASGTNDDAEQTRLATKDGREIDPVTGEAAAE